MRSQTAGHARRGMTATELLELPASLDMETTFRAIRIGRTKGYELLRNGEFPVPVLRLGGTYRVRTADVLALLGIDPMAAASGSAGGDAA